MITAMRFLSFRSVAGSRYIQSNRVYSVGPSCASIVRSRGGGFGLSPAQDLFRCLKTRFISQSVSARHSRCSAYIRGRAMSSNKSRPQPCKNVAEEGGHGLQSGGAKPLPPTFFQRWMAPKEMPQKGTLSWYGEMVLLCTVFAITGTSTMVLVRPAVSNGLGLRGSLKDGPWSYRISSIVIMTPLYSAMLVVVGTLFGRHAYFRHFSVKMFSRFGIPPELMDKTFHETAKNFRKW